ncbi:MAG: hypothetical protein RLZZ264_640 [Bacillota bacterium]|jgi:hypothetical protein
MCANFVHCGNIFFDEKRAFLSEWLSYATYLIQHGSNNKNLLSFKTGVISLTAYFVVINIPI